MYHIIGSICHMSRTRMIYGMAWSRSHLSGVLKLETPKTPLWWIKIKKIKKCAAVEDVRRGGDLSVSRAQVPAPEQDTASGAEAGTRDHAPLVHQLGRNTHTANISTHTTYQQHGTFLKSRNWLKIMSLTKTLNVYIVYCSTASIKDIFLRLQAGSLIRHQWYSKCEVSNSDVKLWNYLPYESPVVYTHWMNLACNESFNFYIVDIKFKVLANVSTQGDIINKQWYKLCQIWHKVRGKFTCFTYRGLLFYFCVSFTHKN